MATLLSDDEWSALCEQLRVRESQEIARSCADACLHRFSSQLSPVYRSFGWAELPDQFGISGKTANRYFNRWTETGAWFDFWDALIVRRHGSAIPDPADPVALQEATLHEALLIELNRAYCYFNRRFMGGQLPFSTIITIEGLTTVRMRGYFSQKLWRKDAETTHHIGLLPGALNGGSDSAMAVLLHEMAHLRNAHAGIQDTDPRTQYHNQDFRDSARLFGLLCDRRDKQFGYASTALGTRAKAAICELAPVREAFAVRLAPPLAVVRRMRTRRATVNGV